MRRVAGSTLPCETTSPDEGGRALGLVSTPGDEVRITEQGRRFLAGDVNARKLVFRECIERLVTVKLVIEALARRPDKKLPAEVIREILAVALPSERPQSLFETITNWGRYAELLVFDATTDEVSLAHPAAPETPEALAAAPAAG